ncbi:MAG: hypothetical protein JNK64_31015 [Myxococcales bacterium]|nr:hypothetical protein [Myxococcales bacterium]
MTRRFALALALAAACGRIGYDPVDGDGGAIDAAATCRFRSLSLGRDHACAVDSAGAVWCWGDDRAGMTRGGGDGPPALTPVRVPVPAAVVEVAAGSDATCARAADGAAWCWGGREGGSSSTLGAVVALDVGGPVHGLAGGLRHMCAVVGPDDHVACWGDNLKGQLGVPPSEPIAAPQVVADTAGTVALTVGHRAVCARRGDGRVRCWGHDDAGQLGLGVTEIATAPTAAPALAGFALAIGGRHACGVDAGGLRCWGRNDRGELGDSDGSRATPGPVIRGGVAAVATAARATCALDATGTVACFGQNRAGELGAGDLAPRATPTAIATLAGVRALAAGAHHVCVERAGAIWCWGENDSGQLGRGTRSVTTVPVPVAAALGPLRDVAVTLHSVCAATASDGAVWCWGDGELGQLGGGAITGTTAPVRALPAGARGLSAAGGQVCAWDAAGAWCWGVGYPGDGRGYGVDPTPARVLASPAITDVAVGFDFACASVGGVARCWGGGDVGQLGDGGTGEALTPVDVAMPTGVVELAAGASHACARTDVGALWCWGENARGQVGTDSGGMPVRTPVQVTLPATTVRAIAAARVHTCALGADQIVYCWGENESGQLGFAGSDQVAPHAVALPAAAVAVFARYDSTCATLTDGQTLCWGANAYGSRGTGDEGSGPTPAPFGAVSGATVVAGAFAVQCAIDAAGALACAGAGSRGALGLGLTGATPAPVALACE